MINIKHNIYRLTTLKGTDEMFGIPEGIDLNFHINHNCFAIKEPSGILRFAFDNDFYEKNSQYFKTHKYIKEVY